MKNRYLENLENRINDVLDELKETIKSIEAIKKCVQKSPDEQHPQEKYMNDMETIGIDMEELEKITSELSSKVKIILNHYKK